MADTTANQGTVIPVTDLIINQKHTTIVVEPTAAADGFDKDSYDSAELTTMLWVDNPVERWVEIPLPFPTENASATIAVISAGPDEYSDRVTRVTRINGNLERFIPYLQHIKTPEDILANKKTLKELLKGFRVAMVKLPAGKLVIRIQASQIINKDAADVSGKTFKFRAYAPLPSFLVPNAAPLKLLVIFKNVTTTPRNIAEPVVSNPFGSEVALGTYQHQDWCGDRFYCWEWKNDPVVDFHYTYA